MTAKDEIKEIIREIKSIYFKDSKDMTKDEKDRLSSLFNSLHDKCQAIIPQLDSQLIMSEIIEERERKLNLASKTVQAEGVSLFSDEDRERRRRTKEWHEKEMK